MKGKHPSTLTGPEEEAGEVFDFEKLRVYRRALDFIDRVYEITAGFPPEEKCGLTDQFRRAAASIALNVAEGSGGSKAEFRRFLRVSRRSVRECVAVTEISGRRGYISGDVRRELRLSCADLSRMLTGLIRLFRREIWCKCVYNNESLRGGVPRNGLAETLRFSRAWRRGRPLRPSPSCEGDKGGGKASPGEKSYGKPSVGDTEAKRNITPCDPKIWVAGRARLRSLSPNARRRTTNDDGESHGTQ